MVTPEAQYIDEIYEAAIVPEHWPKVLERMAAVSGSRAAGLIAVDAQLRPRAIWTEAYAPTYESFARGEAVPYRNVRAERAAARRHAGFLRDIDLCTPEELQQDELYRNFLHPHGLGWTVGSLVNVPTDDRLIFDFARRIGDGPHGGDHVTALDAYRPHLARAAFLSSRLGLERARSMTDVMSALGIPAAVLGTPRRIITTNADFDGLRSRVEPVLFAPATAATRRPAGWRSDDAGFPTRSIPIAAAGDDAALVVHVVPVRRSALDLFSGAAAIALVTPVVAPAVPSAEIVTALFDLTPAEARIARAVAEGRSLAECARDYGVATETLRSQIKAAMGKTGTHRQVDLVRLLIGAASPRRGAASSTPNGGCAGGDGRSS